MVESTVKKDEENPEALGYRETCDPGVHKMVS